jgi:uncharacterized GH25 family protein
MIRTALLLTFALIATGTALAHDFWIAPTKFRAERDALIGLHLQIGHLPRGEGFPRSEARIESFIVVEPSGIRKDVPGREGAAPAGIMRVTEPGLYVVGYRSRPSAITLEAEKFEAYLREEGLDRIVEERCTRGESSLPGREKFSRAAKSIIGSGDSPGTATGFDRVLGFRLELVAEANPFAVNAGGEFPARLMFEGAPVEGVEVHAACVEAPDAVVKARTDKDGRVRIPLSREGHWLLNAVHMVRADGVEADWESLWASLTFATAEAKQIAAPAK